MQSHILRAAAGGEADPTVIGQLYGGGIFVGVVEQSSGEYFLVMSHKSGEASREWKTTNTATPGASDVVDGWANTNAMNNSAYPAAFYCRNYRGGGKSDWYLPARFELEIAYREFKPTTTNNQTGSNSPSPNLYSVPVGPTYTSSVPPRTPLIDFQLGGAEAFSDDTYWASEETNDTTARGIFFTSGRVVNNFKNNSAILVRPFRRVKKA